MEDDVSYMLFQNNNGKQCIGHSLLYKNKKLDMRARFFFYYFFFFLITRDVRASLCAPRLIPGPTEHPASPVDM